MIEQNYWTRLRRRQISRRTLLGASARAGVGAAGLALVGCGDDDDEAPAAAAVTQTQSDDDQAQAQAEAQAEDQADQAEQADTNTNKSRPAREEEEEEEQAVAAVDTEAVLRYPVSRDAGGTDYLRSGSHLNYINSGNVFTTPMFFDYESSALTVNTVEFEVVDETNYVIHHLDGVFFHDGTPQTAEDVLFTLERAGQIAEYHNGGETTDHASGVWTSSRSYFGAQNWKSYDLVDQMNFRVEVNEPLGIFATTHLVAPGIMSKAYIERVGDAEMDVNPIGSGPWRFVSHKDDTDFVMTRYEEFHRGWPDGPSVAGHHRAWSKELIAPVRPEQLTQIAGLEAGELDAVAQLSPDLVAPFLDHDEIKVVFQTAGNPTHQIMPNTHNPELPDGSPNPFLDLRVRQAANMAINREAIIDNVLTGTENPSFGPGPPAIGYAIPQEIKDEIYFGYNPEQAKQLLADAGYPDGFDITLHIVTDYQPIVGTLALIVQQDLGAVGIRTTIKEYLSATYFSDDAVRGRPGEAGLWWFFTNANPDPEGWMGAEIAPGAFYTSSEYPDTNIGDLYYAQKQELDAELRVQKIQDLYVEFYKNASWIFLTEVREGMLLGPGVEWDVGKVGRRGEGNVCLIKKFAV